MYLEIGRAAKTCLRHLQFTKGLEKEGLYNKKGHKALSSGAGKLGRRLQESSRLPMFIELSAVDLGLWGLAHFAATSKHLPNLGKFLNAIFQLHKTILVFRGKNIVHFRDSFIEAIADKG